MHKKHFVNLRGLTPLVLHVIFSSLSEILSLTITILQ